MSTNEETRRVALEARMLVREFGQAMPPRELRDLGAVGAVVSEEMAWALLGGVEPRLGVDRDGNFRTITGLVAFSVRGSVQPPPLFGSPAPPGLWPERAETLDPTIPEGRWRAFLADDDRALDILAGLEELANGAEPPEDFVLPLEELRQGAPPAEAGRRVRRLAWLLTSRDARTLELAGELCARRDRFVWAPNEPPMAGG